MTEETKLLNSTPFDLVKQDIDDLWEEAKNWADGDPIQSQEQHDAVETVFNALRDLGNKADELRKAEVKPFDEGKAEVQAKYHPLIGDTKAGKGKVVLGKEALNKVLADWRDKERIRKEAIAEQARKKAEEEARKAQEAMKASAGNLEAREEAERVVQQAEIAAQDAKRMNKAATFGIGLRTTWAATMTDPEKAVRSMWKMNPQAFVDLAQDLAQKAAHAGTREIEGFEIKPRRKAI